jgi:hypothetical protein
MAARKSSSGGKAEASGSNYETLVAVWYLYGLLLGRAAQPPFDLAADTQIVSVLCQSDAPVDDVNVKTAHGGIIFVQARRSIDLSPKSASTFAQTLDQFVRQYHSSAAQLSTHPWSRPLNPTLDRLVLATRSASSSKITSVLPRLLRGLRDRDGTNTLRQVATSEVERTVAATTEANLARSWKAVYGKAPTQQELGAILRLIWVQELDLESGGRDRKNILEQLRINILEDPSQGNSAFSELFKLAARLRADRSGIDDGARLSQLLSDAGIHLLALPDYRKDIAALKKWTALRLGPAPRFTRLLEGDARLTIDRSVWPAFRNVADRDPLLLVGEPGAGKSGLTYQLATDLLRKNRDVLFLPVDLLNVETFSGLRQELGIDHDLPEVLSNWPGLHRGLFVVDALDAARKSETQTMLRNVIADLLRIPNSRWNVVASVRKYDLRQGTEWSQLFRGNPPIPNHADPEFPLVSHVFVQRLIDSEVAQIAASFPALQSLYAQATDKLRDLLRNIFNLHLLAELLHSGVAGPSLSAISTQPELLDSYWRHRVRRDDGQHDARDAALTIITSEMIDAQMLRVLRASVRTKVPPNALVDLERHGIIRAEERAGKPDEDVLLFNHHILFDYAVARLVFRRGRDSAYLVQLLRARREIALMLSPSLTLALADAWGLGGTRQAFWDIAFALAEESELPGVAQLAAPMIAAELAEQIDDLSPLLAALTPSSARRAAAEAFLQNLIGAIFVRMNSGVPLTGPSAGPWMTLADRLASIGSDRIMLAVRPLLATAVDKL